tara:strand:+ start:269 stop:409 length:141 start_codon:yes stop_codon:yes gene_type:complete
MKNNLKNISETTSEQRAKVGRTRFKHEKQVKTHGAKNTFAEMTKHR